MKAQGVASPPVYSNYVVTYVGKGAWAPCRYGTDSLEMHRDSYLFIRDES